MWLQFRFLPCKLLNLSKSSCIFLDLLLCQGNEITVRAIPTDKKWTADFDAELKEVLGKMYEKYVPQAVREYIESRGDVPPAIKKANRQQGKNSVASGSAAENE